MPDSLIERLRSIASRLRHIADSEKTALTPKLLEIAREFEAEADRLEAGVSPIRLADS